MVGAGISAADFNGDGLDDLTLASVSGDEISFYVNSGLSFQKIPALVPNRDNVKQILWVDYDNDGDKDLYIAIYDGYNRLYQNQGGLDLVEVTIEAGLPTDLHKGFGAVFGDYNRDGWLDLYFSSRDHQDVFSSRNVNRFFKNNADGTFTDITLESRADDTGKIPFCSIFFDYNNDDWPDIFTANDKLSRNSLFENNKRGGFFNVSSDAQVDYRMNAMCSMAGDVNKDGFMDLYITNTPIGNKFLINSIDADGFRVYLDQTIKYGVLFEGNGWASNFFDADNDSDLDLYVSGSWVGSDRVSSTFYEYVGGKFEIPAIQELVRDTVSSFTNAIGDFNDDGLLDIIVHNNAPFRFYLWENKSDNDHNWIKIKLEGVLSNRDGIGSKIEYSSHDDRQLRYSHCGSGFLGQNSSYIHFGLGNKEIVDEIRIIWSSGHVDEYYNLEINKKYFFKEGQSAGGKINVAEDVDMVPRALSTAVIEEYSSDELLVFPNPAAESLFFVTDLEIGTLEIYAIDGKKVKSIRVPKVSINISDLSPGLYTIKAYHGESVIIKQWIKL